MLVTSLPVPQVVGTMISLCSFWSDAMRSYRSSTLSSGRATVRTFAMSMTVPPPTATMRS